MGTNPKFMHLYCHNAIVEADQLSHDIRVAWENVVSLNESYVSEGSVRGVPGGYAIVSSAGNRFRACLFVSKQLPFNSVSGTRMW